MRVCHFIQFERTHTHAYMYIGLRSVKFYRPYAEPIVKTILFMNIMPYCCKLPIDNQNNLVTPRNDRKLYAPLDRHNALSELHHSIHFSRSMWPLTNTWIFNQIAISCMHLYMENNILYASKFERNHQENLVFSNFRDEPMNNRQKSNSIQFHWSEANVQASIKYLIVDEIAF